MAKSDNCFATVLSASPRFASGTYTAGAWSEVVDKATDKMVTSRDTLFKT
jgi:hypothetical protein